MPEALKPCPFCGCSVTLSEFKARDELMGLRTWYGLKGEHKGIGGVCPGQVSARGSAETAITAWNTRTTDPEIARLQDLVAKFQRGGVSTLFAEGNVDG